MNVNAIKPNIVVADYKNKKHAEDIIFLLNDFAIELGGKGKPLSQYVQDNLISKLARLNFAFSLLCYVEDTPVGLINCFTLFSTFQCQVVINIHDLIVKNQYRRQGISQLLMEEVENIAREKGACKITLEVLEKNIPAKNAYFKFGFHSYQLDSKYGNAIFLEKNLS